jgi:hypothetical protein
MYAGSHPGMRLNDQGGEAVELVHVQVDFRSGLRWALLLAAAWARGCRQYITAGEQNN